MQTPNDVNLIIFDMDGTILPSMKPVYEAIKRAFAKLGWAVRFREEDIKKFFGTSSGELYPFIIPAESHLPWQEAREKIRAEYATSFRELAVVFPGVMETLDTLRKRGYSLALYSNSSTVYFDIVISALGIRDCFDYVECVGENDLTKTELVRKIRENFGGLKAAIVGDRIHDIESARETGSLSVGVLFGYGEEEPEQADITINRFDELLSIFDRK
jgi:phosphoglycolate phosphatase-like HAD superfamily hydrolase